jgi:CHU_C Type IX secretion signal domain/PKD-like domain
MQKRLLLSILVLLTSMATAFAQLPPACPSNTTPPADLCSATCIYCDFNGISSSSAGYTSQTPPGWCGSIENEQWLGFIANCNSVTFIATPSNCTNGDGLQIGVYTGCSSSPVSCNGGSGGGGSIPVVTTATTVPGQNYFLCVDGWAGDQCDFNITVAPPTCAGAPMLFPTLPIQGPQSICPNSTHVFTVPNVTGAAQYVWTGPAGSTINGAPSPVTLTTGNMLQVTITFPATPTIGVHQICVQPFNSCNDGTEMCKVVLIKQIPPFLFPPATVCAEDVPYITPWGDPVDATGFYETSIPTPEGCDSVLRQFVIVKPPIIKILPVTNICDGQTKNVCGVEYGAGDHQAICQSAAGCDSTVIFSVISFPLSATITESGPLNCATPADTLVAGPTVGNLSWFQGGSQVATGFSYVATQPGPVTLIVTNTFGTVTCSDTAVFVVTGNPLQPDVLVGVPNQLNCANATVALNATSTLPGVVYDWGGGNATPINTVGSAGTYTVTVTLPGTTCTATASATVTGNTTLPVGAATATTITCALPNATLTATSSNAPTATFAWSNTTSGASTTVAAGGNYTVTITNPTNGCTSTTSVNVNTNTLAPNATASGNTITCANPSVNLTANSTTPGVTYAWTGGGTAPTTSVTNVATYTVTVTNPANGCTSTASADAAGDLVAPNVSATGGVLSCAITQISLAGASTTPGVTYGWTGPSSFTSNQQNPVINVSGQYILTVTGTSNGCTSTTSVNAALNNTQPPIAATGGTISCASPSTNLNASSLLGGATFEWFSAGNVQVGTGAVFNATVPNTYTVVVTNPGNGCTNSTTAIAIADPNIPQVSVNNATITCINTTATLTATSTTPGATIAWAGGTTGATFTPPGPGSYSVVVTNPANGCSLTATSVVDDKTTPPTAVASGGTLTCLAKDLQISGSSNTPGVTYAWTATGFNSAMQNPLVTDPATYTLVVTDPSNGCTSSTTAIVAADTNAPTASSNTGTLTCAITSIALNGVGTGVSPVTKYDWKGPGTVTGTTQSITATVPGDYTVTVTSQNGCTDAATVTVLQDIVAPLAPDAAVSGVIGCTVTSVDLAATTTTTGVTYNWSGGLGSAATVSTGTAGTYTVTITATGNGCTSTASELVSSIVLFPVVNTASSGELNCTFTDRTLNTAATISNALVTIDTYAWSGPGGFSSSLEDPMVTVPGTYTVTVTANNGCATTATATVTQNITPPAASATGGVLTCTATTLALGGVSSTPGATFCWTGACITPANMCQQNPSVCSADSYILTVTAPNGCTTTATAVVTPDANAPTALIAAPVDELTCGITSVNLTASSGTPGVTYKWAKTGSPASLGTTPLIAVTTPGTYIVTVTAPNGCTQLQDQIITQDIVAPTATTMNDSIDCITAQATLTVTTPVNATYAWTGPGNATGTASSITVVNPGTYTVTVTNNGNECTATFTANALPNSTSPNIAITGGGLLTCATQTVTITGNSTTAGVVGAWTGPTGNSLGATPAIPVSAPGVYTYTVTAPNGCKSSAAQTIDQNILPPAALVATASTLTCAAPTQPLNITTTTTGSSYAWSGPNNFTSTLATATTNAQGTYTVTVTGPNGCTASTTATMLSNQNNPNLTASANFATLTCTNPVATLDGSSTTAGVTWSWNGPGLVSTLEDPTTDEAGTYTVTISAPNGCSSTASVTIAINQVPPTATSNGGTVTCAVPNVTLSGNSTTAGATYGWFLNGVPVSTAPNPSVSQLGVYTLVVTAPNGCTQTSTASIISDGSIPTVSATSPILTCAVNTVTITGTSNQTVTWAWTGPNNFTSALQSPGVTVPGPYNVTITNQGNGCTASTAWNVPQDIVTPNLSVSTPPLLDCNTDEVPIIATVTGTHTYSYAWTTSGGNIVSGANQATAQASLAGNYTVVVTDQVNGCTETDGASVASDPNIPTAAAALVRDVKCFGDTNGSISMGAVSGGDAPYLYSINGQPFSSANTFSFLPPGTQEITIQDANGCEVTVAYTIGEPQELAINIGSDTTIRLGEYLDINLDNLAQYVSEPARADTFTYTPANFNMIFCDTCLVKFSTRYTVTVLDSNGCKATDDRLVKVDRTRSVVIPNVFNPSSNSGNNIFTLYGGIDVERIKSFQIYDRWGERVFESFDFDINDNFQNGWNGRFRQKDASMAVYVYVIEVLFKDGETEIYKGDVAIAK